jgi:hypothetical protein
VASGKGLMIMEDIARDVEKLTGLKIEVYGFDTTVGMPKPVDYRDCPNLFVEGEHKMDFAKVEKKLKKAKLIIGEIKNTIPDFINSDFAPIAFVSIDVDYYSSTMDLLKLMEGEHSKFLPRVATYLDDIFVMSYTDFNGELLAIKEFNDSHPDRKFGKIYGLKYFVPYINDSWPWPEAMYYLHLFNHPLYNKRDRIRIK